MKLILPLLLLALCGCRTPATVATLPAAIPPVPVRTPPVPTVASLPPTRPASAAPDPKSRQQAQLIEALINQNDALTARLDALQNGSARAERVPSPAPSAPAIGTVAPATIPVPAEPAIAPNAEGVIDLVAIAQTGSANEPVNPFAVRTAPGEKTREVSLLVGGLILGRTPCAMVNGRLVQTGEAIEGFEVERIEPRALIVRTGVHRLRLPVSPTPTRVKLAL